MLLDGVERHTLTQDLSHRLNALIELEVLKPDSIILKPLK